MAKKVQPHMRPFFERFAKNILTNTVLIQFSEAGTVVTPELGEAVKQVIDSKDCSSLTEAVGVALLERVEYKTLLKVEKFLVSPDARQAMLAAQEVGNLVEQEVYDMLQEFLSESSKDSGK